MSSPAPYDSPSSKRGRPQIGTTEDFDISFTTPSAATTAEVIPPAQTAAIHTALTPPSEVSSEKAIDECTALSQDMLGAASPISSSSATVDPYIPSTVTPVHLRSEYEAIELYLAQMTAKIHERFQRVLAWDDSTTFSVDQEAVASSTKKELEGVRCWLKYNVSTITGINKQLSAIDALGDSRLR